MAVQAGRRCWRCCWRAASSRWPASAAGCTGTASRCAASRRRATSCAPLAAEQIPQVFGYDYQTVERSLNDVYPLLTPDYRREFEDRANKDIIPQARERQLVSQANVVGVGVLDAQRDSASVMVYMNRTVTDKSKQPVYDGSRLRSTTRRSTASG